MALRTIGSSLRTFDARRVAPEPKRAKPDYLTPAYREWREGVIARAGRRCEALVNGARCRKAEPYNRMFADHIDELTDGGELLDPANGMCLCGAHHSAKTAQARAARR